MAYVWLGASFSWLWQKSRQAAVETRFFRLLFAGGAALVAVFFIIVLQPQVHIPLGSFNPARPLFFFLKLGLVVMLLSYLWRREQKTGNRPALVTAVGQESLPVYALHIAVIYGGFRGPYGCSLNYLIGATRSWAEVAAMATALALAMILFALGWHWLKKNKPLWARRLFLTFLIFLAAWLAFRK